MRQNPTYMGLLGPTSLLISEKSATYIGIWFYLIIWQVGVALLKLYIHSLLKLEILLLKGD